MKSAECPSCKKFIQVDEEVEVQGSVTCPFCSIILVLVTKAPPQLDWVDDLALSSSYRFFSKLY